MLVKQSGESRFEQLDIARLHDRMTNDVDGARRIGAHHLGRDFRLLWAGETVSLFGTQVTVLAFPLVALLTLHASPGQIGFVTTLDELKRILSGTWPLDRIEEVRSIAEMVISTRG